MDDAAKKRLDEMETQMLAHLVVLKRLASDLWRSEAVRSVKRDAICETIESLFENGPVNQHRHLQIHQVLHEVEEVFDGLPPVVERP